MNKLETCGTYFLFMFDCEFLWYISEPGSVALK